ncbi:MAG: hypothetical protein ACREBQ_00450 [Nitrososphaerales archaeon]
MAKSSALAIQGNRIWPAERSAAYSIDEKTTEDEFHMVGGNFSKADPALARISL